MGVRTAGGAAVTGACTPADGRGTTVTTGRARGEALTPARTRFRTPAVAGRCAGAAKAGRSRRARWRRMRSAGSAATSRSCADDAAAGAATLGESRSEPSAVTASAATKANASTDQNGGRLTSDVMPPDT